jgi:Uma2 family endonuclease
MEFESTRGADTMAAHSPRKLTYEDFAKIPEDGRRHEILDGAHVVTPAPTPLHQGVSGAIFVALYTFVRERRLGKVFYAPLDVILSDHDIVEPDILFISSARVGILTDKNAQGAPDLVVEILSPGSWRWDLGRKRARYELLGVLEYWVLDPDGATALLFRRDGECFLSPIRLSAELDERLTTPLLPGLEIPLREVFADS